MKTVKSDRASFPDMQRQYVVYETLIQHRMPREPIVPVVDVCLSQDNQALHAITELQECGSLLNYVCDEHPWNEMAVKNMMKKIMMGVQKIHGLGIAHRQIRLENILCGTPNMQHPMLGGWTMATPVKRQEDEPPDCLFIERHLDHLYLAPELFKCITPGHYNSPKQDIFACGVLMHILLFGKSPYASHDDARSERSDVIEKFVMDGRRANKENYFDLEMIGPLARTVQEPVHQPLQMMLTADPKKRPDMNEILHTPFFYDPMVPAKKERTLAMKTLEGFIDRRKNKRTFFTPPVTAPSSPRSPAMSQRSMSPSMSPKAKA